MNLSQLRSFIAVARHGGFTAAARALSLSQATVTSQVQALEREFGVELFHRRGHRIMVSSIGEALLPLARQIRALETEAELLLQDNGALRSGTLRIGAVGPFHVTEMIAAYNRAFPGIRISLTVGNSETVLKSLGDYQCDVGILASFAEDERYASMPFNSHPVILFVSADHPLAGRDQIDLGELHGRPLIMREAGSTTRKALETAIAAANIQPRIAMEIGSREAIREAVGLGLGIGAVSEAEFVPGPNLHPIRITGDPVMTSTHIFWLKERESSRLVQSFLGAVAELADQPSGRAIA
ncbi:LysR family transcriptional regulator [Erythrobacter sp. SG61-1L]|uniref:LysR substrate-binding domain-containing protein n=1 Tax=Erythrobacter sp. SG61-1L TaxID=1603897 RepID=UPI0006C9024D|nr:LysR substrate-binding domain-containing protein [Erythrobacter sp. SG61-1L]KPL68411.1 LysR family transcriptional regulator [Erythrobacter sp. SG61-1L]